MTCSTPSGHEGHERAARTPEPGVDVDTGGEGEQPRSDPRPEVVDRARSMALEGEQVLAGLKDRLDPLADRRQVRPTARLVLAGGAKQGRAEAFDLAVELGSRIAPVADDRLAARKRRREQLLRDLALADVGGRQGPGAGGAVGGEDAVQAHPPEVPGMACAVAVRAPGSELGAARGLDRAPALDRRRVDEQQLVVGAGALGGAEGDDLGVCEASAGVFSPARQEIVRHAVNGGEKSVEVGVHRGLRVDGDFLDTADFGLFTENPSITTPSGSAEPPARTGVVELLI